MLFLRKGGFAFALAIGVVAAGTSHAARAADVPILYNDHHVGAKPAILVNGRVLAGYARNGTILVPLRSAFEQMGAVVEWDAASKTMRISKPGAEIRLTVGKRSVAVNGDVRPLDVPPSMYKGVVVAPVRVISEALGAYVQWIPAKQLVAITYQPPPPPAPAATPVPPPPPAPATPAPAPPPPVATPAPPPTPAPGPTYLAYLSADYTLSGKAYNEWSAGNSLNDSGRIEAMTEFPSLGKNFVFGGDLVRSQYDHLQTLSTQQATNNAVNAGLPVTGPGNTFAIPCTPSVNAKDPGCVNEIGQSGQTFVPAFTINELTFEGLIGVRIAQPRLYFLAGYAGRSTNYGYPIVGGLGVGLMKFPDLDKVVSVRARFMWYPYVFGDFTTPSGTQYTLGYRQYLYDAGLTLSPSRNFPLFFEGGFRGENDNGRNAAPSNRSYSSVYAGLGFKFNVTPSDQGP